MGGFFRAVTRIFSKPPQVVQTVAAPVAAPVAATATWDTARQTLASGGYGSSSVLTSQQGIEDEANVSKTVLGGAVQKKKKV